jgi:transposase
MNPERSKSRDGGKMPMVHPNAAAIDVGATMGMSANRRIGLGWKGVAGFPL